MNPIPSHIPPHLAACVTTHRVMTEAEQRQSKRGRYAARMQSEFTRKKRAENNALGRERSKNIDRLIRVTWEKPFTVSDIVKKARLLGLSDINKKVYSRRLLTLADKGTIDAVGKNGRETLYQTRGTK